MAIILFCYYNYTKFLPFLLIYICTYDCVCVCHLAMPVGMFAAGCVPCRLVWLMFVVFTALHLWANYCAVTVLCMETLNKNRIHIVMKHYYKTGVLLTPEEANALEPVIRSNTMKQLLP